MKKNGNTYLYASISRIAIFLMLVAALSPAHALASTFYFDPEGSTVGVNQAFRVGLLVDSTKPVNAFDVSIILPPGVDVVDSSDGNSVISYWLQRPTYDASRRMLSFSGIVPGGFYGTSATLATLKLKVDRPGRLAIAYGTSTRAILNASNHQEDAVELVPAVLRADLSKQQLANVPADSNPPEAFLPTLATSSEIYSGAWALYFQAQDKGSGIFGYEVAEAPYLIDQYDSLAWTPAESPFLIGDQTLKSYIYVRAMDKMGNARVEVIPPVSQVPWQATSAWGILIGILAILAFAWLLIKTRSSHSPRNRSSRSQ